MKNPNNIYIEINNVTDIITDVSNYDSDYATGYISGCVTMSHGGVTGYIINIPKFLKFNENKPKPEGMHRNVYHYLNRILKVKHIIKNING